MDKSGTNQNKVGFLYFKSIGRILLLLFIAFSLFLYVAGVMEFLLTKSNEEVRVPSVVGKRFLDVYNSLKRDGFNPDIKFRNVYDIDDGIILKQDPEAGSIIARDSSFKLLLSRSSLSIEVPKVIGVELPIARNKLSNLNYQGKTISLSTGVITYIPSDKIEENIIIDQNPRPGERIEPDTKIHLLISSGKEGANNKMSQITDQKIDLCYDLLLSKDVFIKEEIVDTGNQNLSGIIISQNPKNGSVLKKEQEVSLKVYWYSVHDKDIRPYSSYEKVDFIIPDHYGKGHYEAIIEDDKPRRVRFSRMMAPGQRLSFIFQRAGNAKITILNNKKLVRVQSFIVNDNN